MLMNNIRTIREANRVTYVELSQRLEALGRPIAVLGLRRIEKGERRVDVEDLLALAQALGVHPIDLLVPADGNGDPYTVTPGTVTTVTVARAWITGDGFLKEPENPAELAEAIRWMPKVRAQHMSRKWFTLERQQENIRAINRAEFGDQLSNPPEDQEGEK